MPHPVRLLPALVLATSLLAATAQHVRAQGSGDGFLFHRPGGTLTLRGGFARPSASGELFSFTSDLFTVSPGDFSSGTFGGDIAFSVSPRVDVLVSASYAGRSAASEYREFVDNNRLPIEQTSSLKHVPVAAGVKVYVADRGRSIGQYAWVPSRFAPYVGVAGGALWYGFDQTGDFIDFETNEVFPDHFRSSGWTPTALGFAGVDVSLNPRLALTFEGRYSYAKPSLNKDFSDFDKIDLSGISATAGLSIRF